MKLITLCLLFAVGCGFELPVPLPCEDCGADAGPEPTLPQVMPVGTYGGTIMMLSWSGPDTRYCDKTPAGFTIPLYITINGSLVQERINPVCEVLSADPTNYRFVCVNHNLPETCDPGSMYWDPVARNCDAYYERREFALVFSRDAASVTGTVTDTRNWGGCSVRVWTVDFKRR